MEVLDFDGVLNGDVDDSDLNGVHPLRDACYPIVSANGDQPESDRFVERFGSDFDGVFHTFHIFDGDAAGADRHGGNEINIFAFYSPY